MVNRLSAASIGQRRGLKRETGKATLAKYKVNLLVSTIGIPTVRTPRAGGAQKRAGKRTRQGWMQRTAALAGRRPGARTGPHARAAPLSDYLLQAVLAAGPPAAALVPLVPELPVAVSALAMDAVWRSRATSGASACALPARMSASVTALP